MFKPWKWNSIYMIVLKVQVEICIQDYFLNLLKLNHRIHVILWFIFLKIYFSFFCGSFLNFYCVQEIAT